MEDLLEARDKMDERRARTHTSRDEEGHITSIKQDPTRVPEDEKYISFEEAGIEPPEDTPGPPADDGRPILGPEDDEVER